MVRILNSRLKVGKWVEDHKPTGMYNAVPTLNLLTEILTADLEIDIETYRAYHIKFQHSFLRNPQEVKIILRILNEYAMMK